MNIRLEEDISFMKQALGLAEKAFDDNEVPIGAIVVKNNVVIGSGYNQTESHFSQSAHAEAQAIAESGKKIKDWRLDQCTIYVTLEPCLMCMSLIGLARIGRVVYGAHSPLFGYHLDKEFLPDLYKRQIENVTAGVLQNEAEELLKKFFKQKRA